MPGCSREVHFVSHIASYGASQRDAQHLSQKSSERGGTAKDSSCFRDKSYNSIFYIAIRIFDHKINII